MNHKTIPLLIAIAGTCLSARAGTIHVALCGDDAWTGASAVCAAPDGPKRTIQAAINASIDGDVVLIADGTYTGHGNRDINFSGRAITVRHDGDPELCVIDCQGTQLDNHRGFYFINGETDASVLEGLTIRNGVTAADLAGSGVFCRNSGPLISRCSFDHNSGNRGAAVYIENGTVGLVDCSFSNNTAGVNGGAIYAFPANLDVTRCAFSDNTAVSGGGAVWTRDGVRVFTDCTFLRNSTSTTAGGGGGAISCGAVETIGIETFTDCRFIGNSTNVLGGAVWFRDASATVTGCTFDGNSAVGTTSGGGGVAISFDARVTLTNCLFTGNSTGEARAGAAAWVGDGIGGPSTAEMTNCTFTQNTAPAAGAAVFVTQTSTASLANCILWGNTPAQIETEPDATATATYSDIQDSWPGTGNINADPLFISAIDDDCHLAAESPCVDAGDSLVDVDPFAAGLQPLPATDLDGLPRRVDIASILDTGVGPPVVDMGAYEVQLCPADLNGDGIVDFADYLEFLNLFDAGDLRVDFNHDGLVDFADYLEFLNLFDAGC